MKIPESPQTAILPDELKVVLQAIGDQCQELKADLELNQARIREIHPELERLKQNLAASGQQETRQAILEQFEKYRGETAKKQIDRIYQTKISDPKTEQLQGNIAKLEAAMWVCESKIVNIKGQLMALEKSKKDRLAGHYVQKIREEAKTFGDRYRELHKSYRVLADSINLYRGIESDLPGRLRSMEINDPFLVELWGLLGSRDLNGKMLITINRLVSAWTVPNNPFLIASSNTVTGQRVDGKFGLERPFGGIR